MLHENIKMVRTAKGLSQEELAAKLHVVRQTISKWEQGLSVPDADLLLSLSEALETPVSVLLGETAPATDALPAAADWGALAEKLERINAQLAQRKTIRRRILHWLSIAVCLAIPAIFAALFVLNSPYLAWEYSAPETAVMGVAVHALEWLFVRTAPVLFVGAAAVTFLTRKRA